jgi:hypothetical protein
MQEEMATEIAFSQETGILRNPSNSLAQRKASSAVRQYRHAQQTQAANQASRTREELEEQIADLTQKIVHSLANCKDNRDKMTPADLQAAVKERSVWQKQRLDITSSEEWTRVRTARKRRKVATSTLVEGDTMQPPVPGAVHSGSSGSSASTSSGASFDSLALLANTESSFSSMENLQPFYTDLAWTSPPPFTIPNADLTFGSRPLFIPPTFSLQNEFSYPVYPPGPLEFRELPISYLVSFPHKASHSSLIAIWSSSLPSRKL